MSKAKQVAVEIGGQTLQLSNLDKIICPAAGFTKGQIIDYYARIADTVLPHVRNRPMVMVRTPDGFGGESFYQKRCPEGKPEWIPTVDMPSGSARGFVHFCLLDTTPSLIWMVNLGAFELHPLLAHAEDLYTPTHMTFDLDPGPGANLVDCSRVALQLRDLLKEAGLQGFAKSSGKKGMQLNVPLNTPVTYDQTKGFSHALAKLLETHDPERITSNMRKDQRQGKVFVDWSQNDEHKSTVCVYSLRVWERPRVSTPLTWEEVEHAAKKKTDEGLLFETDDVLKRVEKMGDIHEPVVKLKQELPAL